MCHLKCFVLLDVQLKNSGFSLELLTYIKLGKYISCSIILFMTSVLNFMLIFYLGYSLHVILQDN
jgi:hypothetical protein